MASPTAAASSANAAVTPTAGSAAQPVPTASPETQVAAPASTVAKRKGTPSPAAQLLKQTVSRAVWQQLQQQGYDETQAVFWTQLKSADMKEQAPENPQAAPANLLKSFSDKISKVASTVDLPLNRFLVFTDDDSIFVTSDFGVSCDVWRLEPQQFTLSTRWDHQYLDVTLQTQSPEITVQSATCRIDVAKTAAVRSAGEPNHLLRRANTWDASREEIKPLAYPLNAVQSSPTTNAFQQRLSPTGRITCVSLDDQHIRLLHRKTEDVLAFADIVAWKPLDDGLELLVLESTGVRRVVLTTHGQVTIPELSDKLEIAEQESAQDNEEQEDAKGAANPDETPEGELEPDNSTELPAGPSTASARDLGTHALETLSAALSTHCPAARCSTLMCAAQLTPRPLFGATAQKILIAIRDGECRAYSGDGSYADLDEQPEFTSCTLGQQTYVQLNAPGAFQVDREQGEFADLIWQGVHTLSAGYAHPQRPLGIVASLTTPDESLAVMMRLGETGQLEFYGDAGVGNSSPLLTCPIDALESQSTEWTVGWGTANLHIDGEPRPRKLTASNELLIALWESKKLSALTTTLSNVSLGELYSQYNQSRSEKFLSGVFGNFILAHQRLELSSSLASLMEAVESAPPGPLPEELENQLLERLSILEVSRHQLNRWLDRCTLMYPHFRAQLERDWLDRVFGSDVIDHSFREREAWRVHQQTRGELRQVQASMGRAMNEVGQNLQMISFAFPEEVRCAALAATRRAADMADKGAMLAVFGGMGGQLLMGIGRASMGDPLGFAMVGAIGLSLVGKHLQKQAKEKEKKIRLRAYGGQALQWWNVALETAVVMSLECQHALEQSHQAAMARDRKVLEGIAREKLPVIQQRMVDTMREAMQEDVSSQFYEALPGSGIFGWHIVEQIKEANRAKPALAIAGFKRELPGSIGKD